MMTRASGVLCAHCVVASACVALAAWLLNRQAEFGSRYRGQLEVFFARPVVSGAYLLCLLSSFAFPVAVAWRLVGRVPAWRWCLAVAADALLGLVQYVALVLLYPTRD